MKRQFLLILPVTTGIIAFTIPVGVSKPLDTLNQTLYAHEGEHHSVEVDNADNDIHHGTHGHGILEIQAEQAVPTVNLVVHKDAVRGWNLEIQVDNFRFAPERVNQSSLATEGHAHLYVNEEKITRLYGNWFYLEHLQPGRHEVTVSLNANGHEALVYNGQPIEATVMIEVPVTSN